MHDGAVHHRAPHHAGTVHGNLVGTVRPPDGTHGRSHPHTPSIGQRDVGELRLANAGSTAGHGVQHRLHVARRVRDDTQDFADGGLLLQRLLGLVEQARILDRYHRLVGESCEQRNLLV